MLEPCRVIIIWEQVANLLPHIKPLFASISSLHPYCQCSKLWLADAKITKQGLLLTAYMNLTYPKAWVQGVKTG